MKKFVVLLLLCFTISIPLQMGAQRIAVLEFQSGVGLSQSDVDGLSDIFTTYFTPKGYTLVERSQIDRVIGEQQFQRSSLTENQIVKIGEILNLSMIVVGKINNINNEYNVDVRAINVESGSIAAMDGASFPKGSYRNNMMSLATNLSSMLSINIDSNEKTPLPIDIFRKLLRKPRPFTVAIIVDNNLYFADKQTIQEIQQLPYYDNIVKPIAIMITEGENAYGVSLSNSNVNKITAEEAERKYSKKSYMSLPSPDQGWDMWENRDKINELLYILDDGFEMSSQYWVDVFLGAEIDSFTGKPENNNRWGHYVDFKATVPNPIKFARNCDTECDVRLVTTFLKMKNNFKR